MIGFLIMAAAATAPTLNCDNAMTQTDMTICAGRAFTAADAALNAQWTITAAHMKQMDAQGSPGDGRPGYFQALLDAQRAWLRYRDAQCLSAGYYARGGSMEPMLVAQCKAELTHVRTQELKDLVAR